MQNGSNYAPRSRSFEAVRGRLLAWGTTCGVLLLAGGAAWFSVAAGPAVTIFRLPPPNDEQAATQLRQAVLTTERARSFTMLLTTSYGGQLFHGMKPADTPTYELVYQAPNRAEMTFTSESTFSSSTTFSSSN